MKLDSEVNYIVSGLERSGTSMLMQILHAGGAPMEFDHDTRPPDVNNPKGYFELEGGKIISRLMDGSFPIRDFRGRFIKITAFGIKFLPAGRYRIVYTERRIDEILDSMEKMARIKDDTREDTREAFIKLNEMIKSLIRGREDMDALFISYNDILNDPEAQIARIRDFVSPGMDLDGMIRTVDERLHRNRRA